MAQDRGSGREKVPDGGRGGAERSDADEAVSLVYRRTISSPSSGPSPASGPSPGREVAAPSDGVLCRGEQDEDGFQASLRPRTLAEYVGQEQVRRNLGISIGAAKRRGEALDHVLLQRGSVDQRRATRLLPVAQPSRLALLSPSQSCVDPRDGRVQHALHDHHQ